MTTASAVPPTQELVERALIEEVKRQTGGQWPIDLSSDEKQIWAVDTALDFAALAQAAIASLPTAQAADQWEGIESAPKDGTQVDLWGAERERYESSRIPNCWFHDGRWVHGRTIYDDDDDLLDVAEVFNVTHWMPFPPPPAGEGA